MRQTLITAFHARGSPSMTLAELGPLCDSPGALDSCDLNETPGSETEIRRTIVTQKNPWNGMQGARAPSMTSAA